MEQKPMDLRDFVEVLKRRKKHLIIPFLVIFLAGASVALLLPSVFKSTATILIEAQQIPTEFVRSTVTSFAEERIQIITQRIMSRAKLLEIINQFNLYPDLKERRTTEDIITIMRDDIELETISGHALKEAQRRLSETGESGKTIRGVSGPQKRWDHTEPREAPE